jgi:hypothetical protein
MLSHPFCKWALTLAMTFGLAGVGDLFAPSFASAAAPPTIEVSAVAKTKKGKKGKKGKGKKGKKGKKAKATA